MRDVIGSSCVLCQQPIESLFDGVFCLECDGPYHHKCFGISLREPIAGRCSYCGGDRLASQAIKAQAQQKGGPGGEFTRICPFCQTAMSGRENRCTCGYSFEQTVPVSKVCPACGGTTYRRTRPSRFVAFVFDRICKSCKTRYAPPTPWWAGLIFILGGLLLGGIPGGLFGIGIIQHILRGDARAILAMLFEGFFTIVGVLSIVHGIRSVLRSLYSA